MRNSTAHRLICALLVLLLATPMPATAAPMGKLMGMPAFLGLVAAIARVNQAMRSAAENPMDDWRRKNVRTAVAALPPAIVALAAEFQAGNLHNSDLPQVQALLGGFVDVNAADIYKKFLQSPNVAMIPKVGSALPPHLMQVPPESSGSGSSSRLGFDESAARGNGPKAGDATIGKDPYAKAVEKVPGLLSTISAPSSSGKISSSASGIDDGERIGFDESVRAGTALGVEGAVGAAEGISSAVGVVRDNGVATTSLLVDASRDLATAESQVEKEEAEESALDKDFFAKKKKRKTESSPKRYQIEPKPKYWRFGQLIHYAEAVLVHEARAEGGGGGDCADCGSGGKGGGGGDAAGILMAIAAIIAAIVPAIVASIQAEADKQINKDQVEGQKWMTNRTAENSEKLASINQQTALAQAGIQADVAAKNAQGVTDRLSMQLAELRTAREDAAKAEKERIALEEKYNERRIALAEKQADQNLQLARASLGAQLTQAGLAGPVVSNSGNGLSVTPNAAAGGSGLTALGSNGSLASTGGAGSNAANLSSFGGSVPTGGGLGIGRTTGLASRSSLDLSQPMRAMSGEQRLLASLTPDSRARGIVGADGKVTTGSEDEDADDEAGPDGLGRRHATKKKALAGRTGSRSARGIRGSAGSAGLDSRLLAALRQRPGALLVSGSSRGIRATAGATTVAATGSGRGDISKFIGSAKPGFAEYRRRQGTPGAAPTVRGMQSGHAAAAYNEPSFE